MSRRLTAGLAAAVLIAVAAVVFLYRSTRPGTIHLRFKAVMGKQALVFNEPVYANPGGRGMFRVRDFLMYLSNIRLVGAKATYAVPDSYYLARFDNPSTSHDIVIGHVPRDSYSRVILSIGLDEKANASTAPTGDLDPNGRMAWNWEVGYKFVLFEGTLLVDGETIPLVYHVGFNENRKIFQFDLPDPKSLWSPQGISLSVNLLALFTGKRTLDMQALSNVKFDRADASMLANNYATMISLGTAGH